MDSGLKSTLRERLIQPFWNFRGNENKPGVPIRFTDFMQTRPDGGEVLKNSAGAPLEMADLFREMREDVYNLTLNNLAARDDDFRYLFGPVIEDIVWKGFNESSAGQPAMWQSLCASIGVPAAQEAIMRTWIKFSGEPTPTAEGEMFPEVTISQGEESIAWKKKGLTLRLTVEYLRANPLPVVQDYLIYVGRVLQHLENRACVQALYNGDLSTGGNASPVIGVGVTADGIAYADFVRCWTRGALLGERWYTMISGETMGNSIGLIDEFKIRETGTPQIILANRPEPSNMDRWISEDIPDDQVLLCDTSHAVRQRVFIPLNVRQSDKPENWTQGVTIGYSSTFERLADKAVVSIDQGEAFSGNGFPSWFTIGGSRS
jgi:hypothetical protein